MARFPKEEVGTSMEVPGRDRLGTTVRTRTSTAAQVPTQKQKCTRAHNNNRREQPSAARGSGRNSWSILCTQHVTLLPQVSEQTMTPGQQGSRAAGRTQ